MPTKMKVRKGDQVLVSSGKDRGKKGKIVSSSPRDNKIVVEGVNVVKKHARPTQKVTQGGIREMESPIYASKVKLICPSCQKPTRISHRVLSGGKKVRACKKCTEAIDK